MDLDQFVVLLQNAGLKDTNDAQHENIKAVFEEVSSHFSTKTLETTFYPLDNAPYNQDILVRLEEGNFAVAYRDYYHGFVPANVEPTYDGIGSVDFTSKPIEWTEIKI